MHKKHMFLRVFQKIALFACVFCAFSAWAETTTCDINYTPVTGNSIQNGTPTPTTPVAIESVGTKVGNKYQISVVAQGKNLFDKANIDSGYELSSGGTNRNANASWYVSPAIVVKPSTTYYISANSTRASGSYVAFYSTNTISGNVYGGYIGNNSGVKNFSFTTPANCYYIRFNGKLSELDAEIQIEQGSTATSYAPYSTPITTTVYLDEPLRKVGEYADVLDYKNGTITRNVGVKVLDGTEPLAALDVQNMYSISASNLVGITETSRLVYCTHFKNSSTLPAASDRQGYCIKGHSSGSSFISFGAIAQFPNFEDFQSWLAQQYANGTPVTVYYPLATPVVEQIENWSCTPPITDIQIATTKMVDDEFAVAEANLAATVQTIESVVSRTIAQTGQILVLQDTKQTRPDENCPANMKCLLVQDEDGTPHWYPIIEP